MERFSVFCLSGVNTPCAWGPLVNSVKHQPSYCPYKPTPVSIDSFTSLSVFVATLVPPLSQISAHTCDDIYTCVHSCPREHQYHNHAGVQFVSASYLYPGWISDYMQLLCINIWVHIYTKTHRSICL